MKEYLRSKEVGVMYRCKACKRSVRTTVTVEYKSIDNEHPEHYLRHVRSYRRVAGGRWQEAHYFRFNPVKCPGCDKDIYGKAIDGRFKADHPCDARCTGATGHSCECSCGGANHGMDHSAMASA